MHRWGVERLKIGLWELKINIVCYRGNTVRNVIENTIPEAKQRRREDAYPWNPCTALFIALDNNSSY